MNTGVEISGHSAGRHSTDHKPSAMEGAEPQQGSKASPASHDLGLERRAGWLAGTRRV